MDVLNLIHLLEKMKYAGENIYLNKKTELWIDEVQDLENFITVLFIS